MLSQLWDSEYPKITQISPNTVYALPYNETCSALDVRSVAFCFFSLFKRFSRSQISFHRISFCAVTLIKKIKFLAFVLQFTKRIFGVLKILQR